MNWSRPISQPYDRRNAVMISPLWFLVYGNDSACSTYFPLGTVFGWRMLNYPGVKSYSRCTDPVIPHRIQTDGRAFAGVRGAIDQCSLLEILDDDAVAETLLILSHSTGRNEGYSTPLQLLKCDEAFIPHHQSIYVTIDRSTG